MGPQGTGVWGWHEARLDWSLGSSTEPRAGSPGEVRPGPLDDLGTGQRGSSQPASPSELPLRAYFVLRAESQKSSPLHQRAKGSSSPRDRAGCLGD